MAEAVELLIIGAGPFGADVGQADRQSVRRPHKGL
jgi:hypothetical protein